MLPSNFSRSHPGPASVLVTEHELLTRSKEGDHAAFAELVRRATPGALRAIRRILRNSPDVEDVLQDTLLKAFARIESFSERSAFSTWLTSIAVNCALMALRRVRYQREVSMDSESGETSNGISEDQIPASGEDPEGAYMRARSIALVRDAVRRLPSPLRQHAESRWLEEKPHRVIASSFGISLAASKSRAMRAKLILSRSLRGAEGGETANTARAS